MNKQQAARLKAGQFVFAARRGISSFGHWVEVTDPTIHRIRIRKSGWIDGAREVNAVRIKGKDTLGYGLQAEAKLGRQVHPRKTIQEGSEGFLPIEMIDATAGVLDSAEDVAAFIAAEDHARKDKAREVAEALAAAKKRQAAICDRFGAVALRSDTYAVNTDTAEYRLTAARLAELVEVLDPETEVTVSLPHAVAEVLSERIEAT